MKDHSGRRGEHLGVAGRPLLAVRARPEHRLPALKGRSRPDGASDRGVHGAHHHLEARPLPFS